MPPLDPSMPDMPTPTMPVEQPTGGGKHGEELKKFQIIALVLGVLALLFFVTTLVYASQASKQAAANASKYAEGQEAGKKEQKEADTLAYNKEVTSSTRTYTAPVVNGSFEMSYPKAWSLSVDSDSSYPVNGFINPGFVTVTSPEQALRFTLINQPYDSIKKRYDDNARNSKAKSKEVTVSGIKGVQYTGNINDKSKTAVGTVTIVPLRDKTMLMQTDNNKLYLDTYQQMLDTAKLIQ